jgi:predicted lipoprotein with Yx(FWY)xxD motif
MNNPVFPGVASMSMAGMKPGPLHLQQGKSDMTRFAFALWALSAGMAMAAPIAEGQSPFGMVLTADTGMTLYTFTKDSPGVSTCSGACLEHWPPFFADEADKVEGRFTIIERVDETYQWAVDGMPLYLYWEDQNPGDTLGEGRHGTWHVARP